MDRPRPVFFRRRDGWILAGLLALAGLIWLLLRLLAPPAAWAVVRLGGDEVVRVSLAQDATFSIPGLPAVVFEVRGGRAAFVASDCPDQICVHTGWLSRSGQYAACLPNSVSLWVEGGRETGPDAVAVSRGGLALYSPGGIARQEVSRESIHP